MLGAVLFTNLDKMTPKLKAEQLIKAHSVYSEGGTNNDLQTIISTAKNCALITVNALIDEWNNEGGRSAKQKYWMEVRNEVERYS